MNELTSAEILNITGGSFLGVICYSTIGFWVGGAVGFCMGVLPAIPGAVIGATVGAYLGTDATPQVIIIKDGNTQSVQN